MSEFKKPPPLEIKCTFTDCANDLHCFKGHKRMAAEARGKCRACGADLVDWGRVHRRDTKDAAYTFEALQHELIRHHHFHKRIDDDAIRHARRKGRVKLREAVRARLERYLAPAAPVRDGFQTPFEGNTIYYAQHATACCCRTCLEYWHNIPKGRSLTAREFEYCATLIDLYLELRLADLKDEPENIPRRRRIPPGRAEAAE
jgi:Domain of unknown function (DUF4186)